MKFRCVGGVADGREMTLNKGSYVSFPVSNPESQVRFCTSKTRFFNIDGTFVHEDDVGIPRFLTVTYRLAVVDGETVLVPDQEA